MAQSTAEVSHFRYAQVPVDVVLEGCAQGGACLHISRVVVQVAVRHLEGQGDRVTQASQASDLGSPYSERLSQLLPRHVPHVHAYRWLLHRLSPRKGADIRQ